MKKKEGISKLMGGSAVYEKANDLKEIINKASRKSEQWKVS